MAGAQERKSYGKELFKNFCTLSLASEYELALSTFIIDSI
jgi:hypothetical protein